MRRGTLAGLTLVTLLSGLAIASTVQGCGGDSDAGGEGGGSGVDGGAGFGADGGIIPGQDAGDANPCGTLGSNCTVESVGPSGNPPGTFPLPGDDPEPDNVTADGVKRDENGYLTLDSTQSQFDFLWVADDRAYGIGFVSKIQTTAFPQAPLYREVARYVTVTCMSDPDNGSNEGVVLGTDPGGGLCADGLTGCCARDAASNAPKAINLMGNRPSRTTVDINGDMWVANRAHSRFPSVTKIANNPRNCIDRNGNGTIDTSSDVNSDGIITTDCDENNRPDDASTTCTSGLSHEFFGLDDECILFTVNTGGQDSKGRPLALGPGDTIVRAYGPSDAWAGTYHDAIFHRIDGKTGLIKQTVQMLPQNGVTPLPYGAAIDQFGILWAPVNGQHNLFYFDTKNPSNQGLVQYPNPAEGGGFYGIALDGYSEPDGAGGNTPIQQIWIGGVNESGAYRYRPVRDQGFAGLAQGTWAHVLFEGGPQRGRGIGVDNREPTAFAWVALDGHNSSFAGIGRIPTDVPDGLSTLPVAQHTFDTTQAGTLGAGVAFDLDIWGINQGSSSATHFSVDPQGNVVGTPDQVPLDDKPGSPENFCGQTSCKPHPYTYSDFTGFGLRNFTIPNGFYAWVQEGCGPEKTRWLRVEWEAETPPLTSVTMMARSADDPADIENAPWTGSYDTSPADLSSAPGPLLPNPSGYIEVLFELATQGDFAPKLKGFQIIYECVQDVPPTR